MQQFDVVVAGAGPAGSATAMRLAADGARVLLVDKARFPRDKPCGGGLTGRALKNAPCAVDAVVEHVVDRFAIRLRYGRMFIRRHEKPLISMTQRIRLDAHLVEQATAAGVVFRDGVALRGAEQDATGVDLDVGGDRIRADVLVGADGANGITARAIGMGERIVRGVALEANVPHEALDRQRYDGVAFIELGVVPGGYGWVFPKGDHVNLGVGGWGSEGPRLRLHLARLAETHGVDSSALRDTKGHRLPMRRLGSPAADGRTLLVGDAAGLVDPLSGDGIYEAFTSARLAADAIVSGDLSGYELALARALDHHAAASWAAKRALDRSASAGFWAARSPGVFPVVAGLLCGDVSHPDEARGIARPPLRLLARLAA